FREDPRRCRFLLVAAIVGTLGLVGTILGSVLPYALLFQSQPYRVLWILKVMQAPLALEVARRIWRIPTWGPLPASLLLGFFGVTNGLTIEFCFPICVFALAAFGLRGISAEPVHRDWLPRSCAAGLMLGFVGWALYKIVLVIVFRDRL